jgi:hypothetical protein
MEKRKKTLIFGGGTILNIVIYPASMNEVIAVGGLSPCKAEEQVQL